MAKSEDELRVLAEKGIKLLYVCVESGDNDLLECINKGEDSTSTAEALVKARRACIKLSVMIINGVIDTYIQIVEQYLTTTDHYIVTDRLAGGILKNLIELSPALLSETKPNYDTCANFMLTATMGLNGWIAMGGTHDWATHMIGH